MTALVFLLAVGAIVAVVLAIESREDNTHLPRQPIGLLTWLSRGNWPTKVGGALVIVGVGALLRYAALNLDIPPPFKLVTGVLIAAVLGFISVSLPAVAARRSVSLALAGSAFGIAYLTAYSAFALFGYLDNPEGLALLGVTSVAAGAYAVRRGALSLAVLSMLGVFLAPAFAIADPGAAVVYGYYAGASLFTLVLVSLRGWHPLIHLSFLFTLAGGVFFAWTAKYYTGADAGVMLPMLLLLSAIHVAMPILEKSAPRASWVVRADLIYTIALPLVAALLAVLLAANRSDLATALIALGVIWGLAALAYLVTRKEGVAAHAAIAALLVALGVATQFHDLPWELITLAFSVGSLAVAARARQPADRLHNLLAGLVLILGAIHILTSSAARSAGPPFLHAVFIERIVGATLLICAGVICRRIRQPLDTLLLVAGSAWAFVALGIEALRYDLATIALLAHWAAVLLAFSLWLPGRKLHGLDRHAGWLAAIVALTTFWAVAGSVASEAVWISLVGASLALVGLAVRPVTTDDDTIDRRLAAALLAPATAAVWATKAGALAGIEHHQFGLCVAAMVAIVVLAAGQRARGVQGAWVNAASDISAVAFAAVLATATLLHIARNPWAVGLELLCLAGLGFIVWIRAGRRRPIETPAIAAVLGIALVVQANLLRLLGPPGDLDIGDVVHIRFTAVLSLWWAIIGCALTIWSRRASSRPLWFAGAGLLVGAAVKLLIVDFGSLGQLANILAVIAAGAVFLLVGWLVPLPPSQSSLAATDSPDERPGGNAVEASALSSRAPDDHKKTAWTVAVVLSMIGLLFSSQGRLLDPWRTWYGSTFGDVDQSAAGGETSGARSRDAVTVNRDGSLGTTSPRQPETEALDATGPADVSNVGPARDGPFDPARGVLGFRWGTPIDDIRRALPPDTKLVGSETMLLYVGPLQVESIALPKARVIYLFDRDRLASADIATGADEGPALVRILEARLGSARYGRLPHGQLYRHVHEWSTARYGVRLVFTSDSDDRTASGQPADATQIEIQPSRLSTSLIDTIERPDPPMSVEAPTTAIADCRIDGLALPADAKLLAAGAYSGAPTRERLDDSGHDAGRFDIDVHHPTGPVILMLGAYEPAVWYVRWSAATQILAVVASGYHRQVIVGLPGNIPQLVSTYDNRGACGYWYGAASGLPRLDTMARQLFNRPVHQYFVAKEGGPTIVGRPLPSGTSLLTLTSTRDSAGVTEPRASLPAKTEGIQEALRTRLLRPATPADLEAWKVAARAALNLPYVYTEVGAADPRIPMPKNYNAYVILKEFTLPEELYGAHSVSLILPRGIPYPKGDLGHSALFDLQTGTCRGVACGLSGGR